MVLEPNETIVQGDIIIVKKGEEKKLFTMKGLKQKIFDKKNATQKDVVSDANRRWDTTTIPYLVSPHLRKCSNILNSYYSIRCSKNMMMIRFRSFSELFWNFTTN